MTSRKEWFVNRIGKRIYRNKNACECKACQAINKNGLIVANKLHAQYLYDIEQDFNAEGILVRYFDTPDEVVDYAQQLEDHNHATCRL